LSPGRSSSRLMKTVWVTLPLESKSARRVLPCGSAPYRAALKSSKRNASRRL
jgi:hypothetical protein